MASKRVHKRRKSDGGQVRPLRMNQYVLNGLVQLLCILELTMLASCLIVLCVKCPWNDERRFTNCIDKIEALRTPVGSRLGSREESVPPLETVYEQF